jgi:hypothetical protein
VDLAGHEACAVGAVGTVCPLKLVPDAIHHIERELLVYTLLYNFKREFKKEK